MQSLYPFLWERESGFQHRVYLNILQEALNYGVEGLAAWIHEGKYIHTVTTRMVVDEVLGKRASKEQLAASSSVATYAHLTSLSVHNETAWYEESVYQRPRGWTSHTKPSRCLHATQSCGAGMGVDLYSCYVKKPQLRCLRVALIIDVDHAALIEKREACASANLSDG